MNVKNLIFCFLALVFSCGLVAQGSRGDLAEVIVEAFIDFDYEITLLTLTQAHEKTLFCPPIGHRQERGDYQESWQPAAMEPSLLEQAQNIFGKMKGGVCENLLCQTYKK